MLRPVPPPMADDFRCFSRNGRWGTCVDCPRDSEGHVYPEFCPYHGRYDHRLNIEALAEQYKRKTQ